MADSYTKLLLHCDGADASTTITDSATGKTVTADAHAQIDTAQSKFGGASLLLDGTDDYAYSADSDDWDFGSGDFTIDFWAYFNSTAGEQVFLGNYAAGNTGWMFRQTTTTLEYTNGVGYISVAGGYSTGAWYHIAICRSGTSTFFFVNGTQVGTTQTSFNISASAGALDIGRYPATASTACFNGWLDEVRISKGIARWTTNFTAPTQEYDANTGSFFQFI